MKGVWSRHNLLKLTAHAARRVDERRISVAWVVAAFEGHRR
jgi:hypothetical protein